jgi:hypothetical protein
METVKKFLPLNFELMSNPINWAIIVCMVLFAGVALHLIMVSSNATDVKEG